MDNITRTVCMVNNIFLHRKYTPREPCGYSKYIIYYNNGRRYNH